MKPLQLHLSSASDSDQQHRPETDAGFASPPNPKITDVVLKNAAAAIREGKHAA